MRLTNPVGHDAIHRVEHLEERFFGRGRYSLQGRAKWLQPGIAEAIDEIDADRTSRGEARRSALRLRLKRGHGSPGVDQHSHPDRTERVGDAHRRVTSPLVEASSSAAAGAAPPQDAQCGYNQVMPKATSPLSASVGVRDLKNRLSAHLDRVKAGEEITVTEHGRPIARLSPVGAEVDRMTALVNAGIVRAPTTTTRRLPARRVRLNAGGSLDDDVADQRR